MKWVKPCETEMLELVPKVQEEIGSLNNAVYFAARCIDRYVELRANASDKDNAEPIDSRLEHIIQLLFER